MPTANTDAGHTEVKRRRSQRTWKSRVVGDGRDKLTIDGDVVCGLCDGRAGDIYPLTIVDRRWKRIARDNQTWIGGLIEESKA